MRALRGVAYRRSGLGGSFRLPARYPWEKRTVKRYGWLLIGACVLAFAAMMTVAAFAQN